MKSYLYTGPFAAPHPDIKSVEVDWVPFYANWPSVHLIIDRENVPELKDFRFERRDRVFVGVHPKNWRLQYCHSGADCNEGGYGGDSYTLTMIDGSTVTLRGPWSGRAANAHEQGFPRMQEVSLFQENQRVGRAGFYLPVEVLAATLRHHLPHLSILEAPISEDTHLEVAMPEWRGSKGEAQDRARSLRLDPSKIENWVAP